MGNWVDGKLFNNGLLALTSIIRAWIGMGNWVDGKLFNNELLTPTFIIKTWTQTK
jgi:hypothetical protein